MQAFDNAPIGIKTQLAPLISCVLVLAIGAIFLLMVGNVSEAMRQNREALTLTDKVGQLRRNFTDAHVFLNKAFIGQQTGATGAKISEYIGTSKSAIGKVQSFLGSPELKNSSSNRSVISSLSSNLKGYSESANQVADLLAVDQSMAVMFMNDCQSRYDPISSTLDGISMRAEKAAAATNTKLIDTIDSNVKLVLGVILISIIVSFAAGNLAGRAIAASVRAITAIMQRLAEGDRDIEIPHQDRRDEVGQLAVAMTAFKDQLAAADKSKIEQTELIVSSVGTGLDHLAKGDLTHRVTVELTGPFAKLKEDFNLAMARLQETVKSVLSSTHQIATGSSEISQSADDLSRRTEQQAASLEETVAALEEITVTVKKTAANAREASTSAGIATAAAENGGNVVKTAINAMDAIAQSSKQIADIIGVIDEIAFQTNLLALNAGVEAARAG
jgi:methyl-accepting chemotaxis protein